MPFKLTRHTSHRTSSSCPSLLRQFNVIRSTTLQAANRMEAGPLIAPSSALFLSFPPLCKPPRQELDVDAVAAQAAGDEINRDI